MHELSDFIPQEESIKPNNNTSSRLVVLPGEDLDEEFERCYNKTIVELHSALKLLDEWQDFADAIAGKDLRELLGTAYGEFLDLDFRTHALLKDWDLANMVEPPDMEVIDGVVQE